MHDMYALDLQVTLADVAQAASRAGKVADVAAAEASEKVPASLGTEMLTGMHALVRVLGEALVAELSHEGLASMKQVCLRLAGSLVLAWSWVLFTGLLCFR